MTHHAPNLLATVSLTALMLGQPLAAQDATPLPVGANTEPAAPVMAAEGFAISVNGATIAGDPVVVDAVRQVDVQLAQADVQVSFDGLGAVPRLDVEAVGGAADLGSPVTLQSALNYPAYVDRAEMRIVDLAAVGGPRTVATLPVAPNGQVTATLPDSGELVVIHRVYDAQGRFDETSPLPLDRPRAGTVIDGVEDGIDNTARRGIPVSGGAVTVRGSDVVPGARIRVLGEPVVAGRDGMFVLQRILPAGDYGVDVNIDGAGQRLDLVREITIPRAEWFTVATADVTLGYSIDGATDARETYTTGRLAGFVDGKTAGGVRITGSVDTGEGELDDIFERLTERDPRQLLLRVDPDDLYPTYGDDSEIVDATPTRGRVFLRVETDTSFAQWGNFDADLSDNAYVRNDRSLYGLSAGWRSVDVTSFGEARTRLLGYGAQADEVPNRDVFLGTGGSVFFLEQQDIAQASETISIQLRDGDTGRVIETRELIPGEDYQINYIQGIVTLARPLETAVRDGLFTGPGTGDTDIVLVAAYEHRPLAGDVDNTAFGARAEHWLTDRLRLGIAAQSDESGITDHRVAGADIVYGLSEQTYARLDYARSEGTGFDSTFSADGGLLTETVLATGSEGEAFKLEVRAGLADLGLAAEGAVGAYYEEREEGFAALDTNVAAGNGDETYYGVFADVAVNDRLRVKGTLDAYETTGGETDTTGTAIVEYALNDRLAVTVGVETTDRSGGTTPGQRTDAAVKLTYALGEDSQVYVFGQGTLSRDSLPSNDRYGAGGRYAFGNGWAIEGEVSDGDLGEGGRILASYGTEDGTRYYLGYELEAGRELGGIALDGDDRGRIIAGGSRRVNDRVDMFGETTYDLFGRHRSLTSAYGVTYRPTEVLAFTGALELGRVEDGLEYDFDRRALSLGVLYATDATDAQARLEYRTDEGLNDGTAIDTDTLLLTADAVHRFDDAHRVVLRADIARSETGDSPLVDGDFTDVSLGYAYRPVEDDRLNMLARYRYVHDLYGLRDADEPDERGPRQRSHVLSLDASYDVTPRWTLGGKLGYRMAETADAEGSVFSENDAALAVVSARYHMPFEWDVLVEARQLNLFDAETSETSVLGAVYKSVNRNVKVGVGYNFGSFSDDLTDLTYDDEGAFLNIVASF